MVADFNLFIRIVSAFAVEDARDTSRSDFANAIFNAGVMPYIHLEKVLYACMHHCGIVLSEGGVLASPTVSRFYSVHYFQITDALPRSTIFAVRIVAPSGFARN